MVLTWRAARQNSGKKASDVAKILGVSLKSLYNYETYETPISVETADSLLSIYGLEWNDVILYKR